MIEFKTDYQIKCFIKESDKYPQEPSDKPDWYKRQKKVKSLAKRCNWCEENGVALPSEKRLKPFRKLLGLEKDSSSAKYSFMRRFMRVMVARGLKPPFDEFSPEREYPEPSTPAKVAYSTTQPDGDEVGKTTTQPDEDEVGKSIRRMINKRKEIKAQLDELNFEDHKLENALKGLYKVENDFSDKK